MQLDRSNYHSLAAEIYYMSRSQYNNFLECEAQEVARQDGEWVKEKSASMLVGSYVHSWNDGTRRDFIAENPGIFTQKGELKAEYKVADKMIATLENDPLCMYTLEGEKEVILTAEFAGVVWKVMLDVVNRDRRRSVDLKTTKSIREKHWNPDIGEKQSFIEQYKYPLQASIYSEIERIASGRPEGDWYNFYIVAVSKECVPDKEVIDMHDPERYAVELEQIRLNMSRILAVKNKEIEPFRCERCDYCRSTRKLSGAIHYREL